MHIYAYVKSYACMLMCFFLGKSSKKKQTNKTNLGLATHSAFIRIAGFGIDSAVVLDVVVSPLDDAAVASVVSVAGTAVDQILFAEGNQLAGFTEILSFQSTSLQQEHSSQGYSIASYSTLKSLRQRTTSSLRIVLDL